MGYNSKDYVKVRNEFETKYRMARQAADAHRAEVHMLIPEVREIDRTLSRTGMDIMQIITSGVRDTDAEIAKLEARNNELIARREKCLTAYGFAADYTDVHYECDRCGDTGFVEDKMCDCMKRALSMAGYESSGLGRLIGKQTFENFELGYYPEERRQRIGEIVRYMKKFAEEFDGKKDDNFLFIGSTGLGKTHLSTAVAQRVIDRGYDVLYVSSVAMMSDFESNRFGSSGSSPVTNEVQRYYSCDLLILDDLGTEVINKFTQSCLYEVINSRICAGKPTIINTNCTPTELQAMYTDRISSRLLGEYNIMQFVGLDIRRQKSVR